MGFRKQVNMASANRDFVWLDCTSCGARNYRAERALKPKQKGKETVPANMKDNRLEMNKYCPKERKHTLHKESRKK